MRKENDNKLQKGEILIGTVIGFCAVLGMFAYTKIKLPNNVIFNFNISGDYIVGDKIDKEPETIELPTFASKEELLKKIKANSSNNKFFFETDSAINSTVDFGALAGSAISSDKAEISESTNSSMDDYSTTNTQVKGVDESDIVKTNGKFIYYMSKGNLYIFDTKTTKTELVKTIKITNGYDYLTQELYIDDNYITVIAQEYVNRKEIAIDSADEERNSIIDTLKDTINENLKISYYEDTNVTAMYVYDINSYELVKTVKTEGAYISSRKTNDNIYLVTNRYIYSYGVNEDNILPIYLEKNAGAEVYTEIPAQNIKYFPEDSLKENCSYMIITSVNLADINSEATIDTFLGAGTEIYSSKENLYVTKVDYNYGGYNRFTGIVAIDTVAVNNVETDIVTTKIHKFELLDGKVKYIATGEVPGALLNQYSMDENNKYFRITTTSEKGNSLYVLNEKLEIVGDLENLAKGEKIYATRFMGDKCYLVTYKTVDPLFVIDLSNPEEPKVLGELKIPGYSTYLHPLGENYLIGFGEDSVEKSYLNWRGEQAVTAYNVGLKLAIFDITDLNNPKELHSIKIGGRGSYTELLNNPKVLYFDEEKELFAFPASLTEETKFYQDGTPMYGDVIFDGALVYNLSVEDGISLRGKIEHDLEKNEKYYYGNNIERIISIKDNFYTLSPNMLKVTNINTMEEIPEGTCTFGDVR